MKAGQELKGMLLAVYSLSLPAGQEAPEWSCFCLYWIEQPLER